MAAMVVFCFHYKSSPAISPCSSVYHISLAARAVMHAPYIDRLPGLGETLTHSTVRLRHFETACTCMSIPGFASHARPQRVESGKYPWTDSGRCSCRLGDCGKVDLHRPREPATCQSHRPVDSWTSAEQHRMAQPNHQHPTGIDHLGEI